MNRSLIRYPLLAASVTLVAFGAGRSVSSFAAVDAAKSSVSVVFKQMNVPVEGKFNRFAADIRFDPANAAAGTAKVDVDIGSFDIGSPDYNKEVAGKEWFDTASWPHATFVSTQIKPAGNGAYSVTGKLTVKGKTTDVVIPVQYHKEGGNEVFDGTLPIKRLTYGIGDGEWKDTSVVADGVQIKFHVIRASK